MHNNNGTELLINYTVTPPKNESNNCSEFVKRVILVNFLADFFLTKLH